MEDKVELSEANQKAQDAVAEALNGIHQGDKIFLRNQLDMSYKDLIQSEDFILAVALWKHKGGGTTNWQFVMNMTDVAIAEELGFEDLEDDDESE